MVDDPRVTLARKNEREARLRLEDACKADLASVDALFAATMTLARQQLQEALVLKHADLQNATEAVILVCVRRLRDSADIRFRARFRNYAEAVWQGEANLLSAPRRTALPHVELEAPKVPPLAVRDKAHVDAWLCSLAEALRQALVAAVDAARRKVIRRVVAGVARARARRSVKRGIAG